MIVNSSGKLNPLGKCAGFKTSNPITLYNNFLYKVNLTPAYLKKKMTITETQVFTFIGVLISLIFFLKI